MQLRITFLLLICATTLAVANGYDEREFRKGLRISYAAMVEYMREANLPHLVQQRFYEDSVRTRYDIAFPFNPIYLRGDLTGDGAADYAVAVVTKNGTDGGIIFVSDAIETLQVIGAGDTLGSHRSLHFGIWEIIERETAAKIMERVKGNYPYPDTLPTLFGEVIVISAEERTSAYIYWDGDSFEVFGGVTGD